MEIHFPVELQGQIEKAIVSGELRVGELVNTTELAARFHSSLDKMQEVLLSEYRKALLERDGAKGFRVLGLIAPQVESVFQHTSRVGFKPSSVMRGVTIEPASIDVAMRLDVPVGAPVYRLDRTRLVNGEVLANQTNMIPYEVCAGLENDDVSHASFQQLIDGKYRAVTREMKEGFTILSVTEQDSEILSLAPGTPVLSIRRLALSATSSPLIWTEIHVRLDRFDYVAALWPSAKTLVEQFQSRA